MILTLCFLFCGFQFVYPIVAHSVWSNEGFLSPTNADPLGGIGFIDAAGSGAVHLCGGVTALIAAIVLGPRQGRFHDHEGNILDEPCALRGHSMAFQLLGTIILWFGCKSRTLSNLFSRSAVFCSH